MTRMPRVVVSLKPRTLLLFALREPRVELGDRLRHLGAEPGALRFEPGAELGEVALRRLGALDRELFVDRFRLVDLEGGEVGAPFADEGGGRLLVERQRAIESCDGLVVV